MTFAEKLLKLRKRIGLSQEELAARLEVSRQAVSRWEMGSVLPDSSNLLQISKLFGVSTDYLLYDEFEEETDIPIVKNAKEAMKKDHNRKIALLVLVGLQGLGLLWGLFGWWTLQNEWVILFVLTIHIINILVFEITFHRYGKEPEARTYKRKYYRISVWMFSLFPIGWFVNLLWYFYPGSYRSIWPKVSSLVVYLLVCGGVSRILKERSDK